jgi:hypothetical protein
MMRANVKEVVSDIVIGLDRRWTFHDFKGSRVKIAGLLPSQREKRAEAKKKLGGLVKNKEVEIKEYLYVSGDVLTAIVYYNEGPLQDQFTERRTPTFEPSRWTEPDESSLIDKVFGGLPKTWSNPINELGVSSSPFWGNIAYPMRFWEKDYERSLRLARQLYSDSHQNKEELDRWFDVFLSSPHREAALIVKGDVGVGKSWWIAHKLSELPKDRYDVILIDLRYRKRNSELGRSIQTLIGEFLNRYVRDLRWLYPEFEAIYGDTFDPADKAVLTEMRARAISLTLEEMNEKRLRNYELPGSHELIVAFDNIDHFREREILTTLDLCRRIIGDSGGVKVIVAMRPTTRLPKSRKGVIFGDVIHKTIELRSPDLYSVLEKRLSTNDRGETIDRSIRLAGSNWSIAKIFEKYRSSDRMFGSARLLRHLCCTEVVPESEQLTFRILDANYDLRYYIKLFRRLLRSDTLLSFDNIGNIYYAIHALLLRGGEPISEGDAHLFNLFDNEHPDLRGNALARYRVLEYCALFHDLGEIFDVFFRALGVGSGAARAILDLFEDAGLVDVEYFDDPEGQRTAFHGELSIPGKRHFELVTNLWYVICIKTGMNIYRECILFGNEARREASKFVQSNTTLDFYSKHGWVPESRFVDFLASQVTLEGIRIGQFEASHAEWREQIANMTNLISNPAFNIYLGIEEQLVTWARARQRE